MVQQSFDQISSFFFLNLFFFFFFFFVFFLFHLCGRFYIHLILTNPIVEIIRHRYILHLKHLSQEILKEKIFEYFSMYFYASKSDPPRSGSFGPLELHLKMLVKDN